MPVRRAFTIVELLVVMGVIGVVVALSFPAIQAARETARRSTCQNNLRQQLVALHGFHSTFDRLPAGREETVPGVDIGWGYQILPQLEQHELFDMYDPKLPLDEENNFELALTPLPVFSCPTSPTNYPGESDYGGVSGSVIPIAATGGPLQNGSLVESTFRQRNKVTLSHFADGTAFTIMVAESADRDPPGGLWASGGNIFGHHHGEVNAIRGHMYSLHPKGCNAGFADTSVRFLSREVKPAVLGALCTRGHGEVISSADY